MLAASDADLPQTLAKYTDLDKMLDYMAVDYAIANWDGITTFYAGDWGHNNHNFYMYQDEDRAHFTLIPWDLNATFDLEHWLGDIKPWDALDVDCDAWVLTKDSTDLYTIPAACDPTIRALALSKDGYRQSAKRLLDEVFVVDSLNQKIGTYLSQVSTAMENDPFVTASEVRGGAQYIKGQLATLRKRLEAVLTEPTSN
ncbi:MAG: CotH kinase family protein [Polyangiaceae bacterium]